MIPYAKPHIDNADRKAVDRVLHTTSLTQGSKVREFEDAICEYTGAKYCVAFNSGTSALHAAYLAVDVDDCTIVMNPVTFVATANMAKVAGAEVFFRDKNPGGVDWVSMHYAGRYHGPGIIEDACHALGSDSPYGKVGNCGGGTKITVFSTHAIKNITTGEGGLATTNDSALHTEMKLLSSHGRSNGAMLEMGYNYRMTDIQAALGISQLKKIDKFRDDKLKTYYDYDYAFWEAGLYHNMDQSWYSVTNYHLYVIETDNRDKLAQHLLERGIQTRVHYPPVHLQPYWGGKKGTCPKAEAFADRCLSLPLWVGMKRKTQDYIIESVKEFYNG